ncbi:hypothetical protein CH256_13830 [Rhodococcus sp. 05-2254-6]|nr:hypothetical protein CH256_13830 [Rhodococcus sp. 05-2254-6]
MTFMQLSKHKIGCFGSDAAGDIAGSIRERRPLGPPLQPSEQHLDVGCGGWTQISALQWGLGGEKWGMWVKVGSVGEGSQNSRARECSSRPSTRSGGLQAILRRLFAGRKRQQHLTRG